MSPAKPVPIVRRAPAAGLFGRRSEAPAAGMATATFPWEQLLFGPVAGDGEPPASVVVPFPASRP